MLIRLAPATAALLLPLALQLDAQIDRITGKKFATRSEVLARHGMVCTSVPLATQVGIDVSETRRQRGGRCDRGERRARFDGAGFERDRRRPLRHRLQREGKQTLRNQWQRTFAARPELRANESRAGEIEARDDPATGMLPISVPGCVDAWAELHKKFGKLKLGDDLAPAIRYAEEGFPVSELIAYYWGFGPRLYKGLPGAFSRDLHARWQRAHAGQRRHLQESGAREDAAADRRKGRDAFYKGEIAEKIDAFMQANGGYLRKADFEKHTCTWVDPVSTNYRGYDVFELPPNGQGIAALQMLNILEGFDLRAMGRNSPDTLHAMIEAKKIAWADRAKFYADPAFAKIPLAGLISKTYAAERRKLIDPKRAAKTVEAGNPALEQGDTIYMCTADDEGNMVSLIQSNYRGMGSGIVVPGLGFMFQDRGELFSMEPGHANVYAPGKRPFHTIIPGFVMKDGKPWEAFGVMGGGMQPQGHVQVLTNQIDFGINVQEAGDASRWQHEGDNEPTGEKMENGGYVNLESGIPYETARELSKRGHDVRLDVGGYGGYQAIKVEMHNGQRVYVGASESRKDGQAAGY